MRTVLWTMGTVPLAHLATGTVHVVPFRIVFSVDFLFDPRLAEKCIKFSRIF